MVETGGHSLSAWIAFHVVILVLLALDLGIFNRKAHVIRIREAVLWSIFWIVVGISFGAYLYYYDGAQAGIEYLTGYVVEKSLSVDNLFVFLIIFEALKIPRRYQHRLLFWGIFGAIILRGLMILAGTQLLLHFHWMIYVFGLFLIYTGLKLLGGGSEELDPKKSPVFRLAKRFLPLSFSEDYKGRFTIIENGQRKFTLAFVALLLIESSDVIFALDSVPAVFGVTRDPFIVYTSNIFAILGLRSLFFVLEDLLYRFHLLKVGLAIVLVFVGVKMCVESFFPITPGWSLAIIGTLLGSSIVLSLMIEPKGKASAARLGTKEEDSESSETQKDVNKVQ